MSLVRTERPTRRSGGSRARRGEAGRARGLGDSSITVKGKRADAEQRAVIDEALEEAYDLGASRRVMIAAQMTMTQESVCRRLRRGDAAGPDSRGPFQQRAAWGPEADRLDPAKAMRMFLTGGKGGQPGWKQKHGGLKHAPGDLEAAIVAVQVSVGGYGQWEREATETVDTWLGERSGGGSYRKRYDFTRGQRGGERESSWDAMARLMSEVRGRRWAAGNVLFAVSDDELLAAAPSLTVRGDEAFLLRGPAFRWASGREIVECTLAVLVDRWDIAIGAVVVLHQQLGALAGRWLVAEVSGARLDSPAAEVVLRRPVQLRAEPPAELATRDESGGDLHDEAKRISDARGPYVYGGGHGPKLARLKSGQGLDCSSSCSLALKRAGMFHGDVAIVSGDFARSWGKPGKGDDFTVWANASHVWIEGYDKSGDFAWRFDTSPHGDGGSGPRLRRKPRRDHERFTARHWSGR